MYFGLLFVNVNVISSFLSFYKINKYNYYFCSSNIFRTSSDFRPVIIYFTILFFINKVMFGYEY